MEHDSKEYSLVADGLTKLIKNNETHKIHFRYVLLSPFGESDQQDATSAIMDLRNFKKHLEAYVALDDQELEIVAQYFTYRKLKKDQVLIKAGDRVTNTYWVKHGLLVSSYNDNKGKEHIIQFAIENCWITDQQAFYNKATALFTIISLEDSELLCLSYDNREKLCSTMPKMEHFFRKKANDSFVKQQRRLLTYLTSDAAQRFDLLMQEYPGLYQRVTKKILAAYLGVSRETLSRFRHGS